MNWFMNLKIKAKLVLCFIIVAVFTAVVGIFAINGMNKINQNSINMYNENFTPSLQLKEIRINLQDIRANLLRAVFEKDLSTLSEKLETIKERANNTNSLLVEYEKIIETSEERTLFDEMKASLGNYQEAREKVIVLMEEGRYDEAFDIYGNVTLTRQELDKDINAIIQFNNLEIEKTMEDNQKSFKLQSVTMLIIVFISLVIAIAIGILTSSLLSKQVNEMVDFAQEIADGNLDVSAKSESKDEIGELSRALDQMASNINEIMSNINASSEQVSSGASQVSNSSIALSQGSTEQASSVEELTASLEEVSVQTKQNAENANKANELAISVKTSALQGDEQMQDMLKSMDEINESSSNIYKIIKVIDDIAFQTNILALNAAVEAARAGQHGMGFAVVAEEVRTLAARSANAAKETTELIEGSIKKTEDGTKIARDTAKSLDEIVAGIELVANLVEEIDTASNEQATAIAQINQGIIQVSDVVQSNSATSQESAAASEELSSQAELLMGLVRRFKLKTHTGGFSTYEEINPDVLLMLKQMAKDKNKDYEQDSRKAASANKSKISLNDNDFGKY